MPDIIIPKLVSYDTRWKQQIHRNCTGQHAPNPELVPVSNDTLSAIICKKCKQMWLLEGISIDMPEWEGYDPGAMRIIPANGRIQ